MTPEIEALPSAATNPDIQESLSLRYSDRIVVVLQLRSGNYAIYNNLRELCGVVESLDRWPPVVWRAPRLAEAAKPVAPKTKYALTSLPRKTDNTQPAINLKELGLS